jgi:hypothetical protein
MFREAFSISCHQTHPIHISHLILLKWTFIFKPLEAAVITITQIYAGRSAAQILAGAIQLSLLQNIQTSSSTHPVSNSSFSSSSKVASADNLTTHICLEPNLNISGAIPPLHLSASTAHIGTILFYLYLLPMYTSLKRSQLFWSYK